MYLICTLQSQLRLKTNGDLLITALDERGRLMFIFTELKYQLIRNKNRSLLMVMVAALLVGCMAFYLGNIQSNEMALQNLSESVPVKVWVVNRSGESRVNLSIDETHFNALTKAGVHDSLYLSCAAGTISKDTQSKEMFLGGDTNITGANDIRAISGLSEDIMQFSEGYDSSFLSGNEAVCAVGEDYAKTYRLNIGNEITMPIYAIRYSRMGPVYQSIGEVKLTVIGSYSETEGAGITVPQMIVPVQWLKDVSKKAGVEFYYESLSTVLDNSMELNQFKETLPKMGFLEVFDEAEDTISGDAISIEDELFIKTAGELQRNLIVYKGFLPPFFMLVIGLITLVTFLILRSSQREMAIASSLGRSKKQNAIGYFLATLLADIIGCIIALPVMYFLAGIAITQVLVIIALFLFCSGIGITFALIFLLRFDTLAMLTKLD